MRKKKRANVWKKWKISTSEKYIIIAAIDALQRDHLEIPGMILIILSWTPSKLRIKIVLLVVHYSVSGRNILYLFKTYLPFKTYRDSGFPKPYLVLIDTVYIHAPTIFIVLIPIEFPSFNWVWYVYNRTWCIVMDNYQ